MSPAVLFFTITNSISILFFATPVAPWRHFNWFVQPFHLQECSKISHTKSRHYKLDAYYISYYYHHQQRKKNALHSFLVILPTFPFARFYSTCFVFVFSLSLKLSNIFNRSTSLQTLINFSSIWWYRQFYTAGNWTFQRQDYSVAWMHSFIYSVPVDLLASSQIVLCEI